MPSPPISIANAVDSTLMRMRNAKPTLIVGSPAARNEAASEVHVMLSTFVSDNVRGVVSFQPVAASGESVGHQLVRFLNELDVEGDIAAHVDIGSIAAASDGAVTPAYVAQILKPHIGHDDKLLITGDAESGVELLGDVAIQRRFQTFHVKDGE